MTRGGAARLETRVWRLGLWRGGLELRLFRREPSAVIGTLALPAVLLILFGSIFAEEAGGAGVTGGMVYTASMVALAVASASFVNLGLGVAVDREDGTLARLRRVPAPAGAYLLGKVILVLVTNLATLVVLLATAALVFNLALPTDPARWWTFAWVYVLGVTACSLLGVAVSGLAGSARAAGAVMNLPFLVINFASGIFIPLWLLPPALSTFGSLFPVKWLAQGFRSALLPAELAAQEPAGSWEHGRIALVLTAWCIGGLVLCLKTFRWRSRRDG